MGSEQHGQSFDTILALMPDTPETTMPQFASVAEPFVAAPCSAEPPLRLADLTIPLCFVDAQGVIQWANPAFRSINQATMELAHPGVRLDALVEPADRARLPIASAHPIEVRFVDSHARGHRFELRALARLPLDAPGGVISLLLTATDTEERHARDDHESALRLELGHRLRNLVMVVAALVNDTVGQHHDGASVARLLDRLRSLQTAGYVGNEVFETDCSVARTARRILDRFHDPADHRVLLDSEDVTISRRWGNTLALIFHELATNSLKYGALSSRSGSVMLRWCAIAQPSGPVLHVEWREVGGPVVHEPNQLGEGLAFVKKVLSHARNAGATFRFVPTGFACQLDVPIEQLGRGSAAPA